MMRVTKQFQHLKIQLQSIISATNNFSDDNCIGKGGFGKVYKGDLIHSKGHTLVAIKRLNRSFGQGDPEFWKEIIMLSHYKHENIVSLLGYCDESGEKILVYEYASNKSLDLHLNNNDLTWIKRLKICIGAARGLAYLYDPGTTQQRILHRDIKSSNILLDETWNARISDFGLSKFAPANQQISFLVSNGVGTIGYCDPIYVETGLLTKESDVYSFGVVLFEVLCGRLCIGNNNNKRPPLTGLARQCYKQNKLHEIIYGNIKDEINSDSLKAFSTIAYQCLKRDTEERPLMAEVVRVLESALEHQEEEENAKPPVAYTIVEIIQASHMRLADPYVKGQLGPYKFRTKPQKKTSSPKWFEEFKIPIHTWESPNVLMIEIWNKNLFIDGILSNCSITINDFKDGRRHDIWVPLQNVTTGRLNLAITVVEVDLKGQFVCTSTDSTIDKIVEKLPNHDSIMDKILEKIHDDDSSSSSDLDEETKISMIESKGHFACTSTNSTLDKIVEKLPYHDSIMDKILEKIHDNDSSSSSDLDEESKISTIESKFACTSTDSTIDKIIEKLPNHDSIMDKILEKIHDNDSSSSSDLDEETKISMIKSKDQLACTSIDSIMEKISKKLHGYDSSSSSNLDDET